MEKPDSQHIIPSPPGVAQVSPSIIVLSTSSVPSHKNESTSSAHYLPTRPWQGPTRQPRLRNRLELPVEATAQALAVLAGHVDEGVIEHGGACFQHADPDAGIRGQASGHDESRRPAADN